MSSLHSSSCGCCADLLAKRFDRRRFLQVSAATGLAAAMPSFAFAASGNYEAMLLNCIDPRFPQKNLDYMRRHHLAGKHSQFVFAGAAIGVVSPAFKDWAPAFWENLAATIQLHNIKSIIAIDHRDCGAAKIAYGEAAVATPAKETETHKAALAEFRSQVAAKQPKLKIETGLMALNGRVEMFR